MFLSLLDQEGKGSAGQKVETPKMRKRVEKNQDLEDGEIMSDREEKRARDPYRDDRRDHRREERHEPKRPNYYENGDRLNFHRHRRDGDRAYMRPSWQGRSPPARPSPY